MVEGRDVAHRASTRPWTHNYFLPKLKFLTVAATTTRARRFYFFYAFLHRAPADFTLRAKNIFPAGPREVPHWMNRYFRALRAWTHSHY